MSPWNPRNEACPQETRGRGGLSRAARTIGGLLAFACAGCGGAPSRVTARDAEARDAGFAKARPEEAPDPAIQILSKPKLDSIDLLNLADLFNPELAAERANIDLATAALWAERLYPNPSAFVSVEEYPVTGGERFRSAKVVAGLNIPIAIGGRVGAGAEAAELERNVASLNYVWRRREILSRVKESFVDYLAARRTLQLATKSRDLAKELQRAAKDRFEAQAAPEMELLKADVDLARAESDLRRAARSSSSAFAALATMVGAPELLAEKLDDRLQEDFTALDRTKLEASAASTHPLIQAADVSIDAARGRVRQAEVARIPDLTLGIDAGRNGEGDAIVEASIEVELPVFNSSQARVFETEARTQQALHQAKAVRASVRSELRASASAFENALDRASTFRQEILPKARRALEQTQDGYRLGKFTLLDVLDSQRTLADAESAYVDAVAEVNKAAIEIEKQTGEVLIAGH